MNSNTIIVSIIVPNYNCAKYISDTIKSVQEQTYKQWEMIIIDDCSTDNSIDIVNKFIESDNRIKIIALDKNNGFPAIPRNIGINESNGKYIAFLDSDDLWHPKKLEIQLNILERIQCKFISSTMNDFIDLENITNRDIDIKDIKNEHISMRRLLKKDIIPTSSVLVEKSLLNNLKFIEDIKYIAVEDYQLWLNMHENIEYSIKVKFPLMNYRVTPSSLSSSKIKMFFKVFNLLSKYTFKDGRNISKFKLFYYINTYIYYSLKRVLKKSL